jgi:hypothetical protein
MDVARRASVDIGAHDSVTIRYRFIGLHRGANNGRNIAILEHLNGSALALKERALIASLPWDTKGPTGGRKRG